MERRDPVPVGRYWVYIDESEVSRWQAWVASSASQVQVLVTEAQQKVSSWIPAVFVTRWDLDIVQSTVGYWVLFDVLSPVKWVGFGYPTRVIDPKVKSATDVSTAPEPDAEWNPLGELASDAKWVMLAVATVLIVAQVAPLVRTLAPARSAR